MKFLDTVLYIFITLCIFMIPESMIAKTSEKKPFTIVVDAGHGGKDLGACDNNAREKEINLGVAKHLQKLIKKGLKDSQVVMTREEDKYLTLQERADLANKAKGDLFISIHTNSVDKSNKNRKNISGSSVYVLGLHKDENNMKVARRENSVIELESNFEHKYSGFDPSKDESYIIFEMAQKKNLSKSIKFAELAQKQLKKAGRADRGVHQAGFWVLWATSMPSVLVELDFICNPESAKYIDSEKGQKELAEALYNAVSAYYNDWKRMQGEASMTRPMVPDDNSKAVYEDVSALKEKGSGKVVASSRSNVKKESHVTKNVTASGNAKRKRRNDLAKANSSSRNVETDVIPLHSSMERVGKVVENTPVNTVEDTGTDNSAEKEKNSKNKKAKKEKNKKKDEVKKNEKKVEKKPSSSHSAKVERFVTVYKIQILDSNELLKQNNPLFCGLSPITTYKENNKYKYFFGESENLDEIKKLLKEVKDKIPGAFIVASKKMMSTK